MGIGSSSCCSKHSAEHRRHTAKIAVLEKEIHVIRREKEQREAVFSWERKKLKDEVAGLRKRVLIEEEEMVIRRFQAINAAAAIDGGCGGRGGHHEASAECCEWCGMALIRDKYMMERKEAAVEKWKQLYFAIKSELDQLILTTNTNQREMFCWGSEQGVKIEGLKAELKAKEEALEALRAKLCSLEREGARREGEIDILRQSLRILSSADRRRGCRNLKKRILRF